ncbi:polyglutamylase complex subunit TTLL1-like isoform X1 [Bacillus rossius redtenbacheri]|uniref:polyglutamylase complex subunit TTLL1-like isoform X1 n=1 Tax=Bacillus rossius redtenbacheri TaxID=93214 RepID=UPI002FDD9843
MPKKVRFAVDAERCVVMQNFAERGWIQVSPQEDWNIYWARTQGCRDVFRVDNRFRLRDDQMVNHFPNSGEISRKDRLVRNWNIYCRSWKKNKGSLQDMDFLPTTYILPGDYSMLVEAVKRETGAMWIVKPASSSQGAGIFLINKLGMLRRLSWESKPSSHSSILSGSYVVSKYIDNPLLIGGKKFDLRMYVLVMSFRPLKAYLHRQGFCRFCTAKYTTSVHELDNNYIYLTNVSVQSQGGEYNCMHGGKLSVENLRLFLESTRGKEVTEKLFASISWLIVHSLKAVVPVMANDRHCFECYGYDIIIDNRLKPWLVEVNSSPSLFFTTQKDYFLKLKIVDDVLSIVLPPDGFPSAKWDKTPSRRTMGDFDLLLDEELAAS